MSQADPLLQPLRLKNLVLKNRVMSTSHAPAYVVGGLPLERYQLYHEEKAKGGLALTMFGGSSTIAPESPSAFGQVDISHDRIVPALRDFSRRIHAHGCALMVQITHMGRRTRWDVADWLVPVAPSRVREFQHRSFPKELEREELRRIVEAYAAAARRAKEGGLDGVELLTSGHLMDQFWSPATNKRADEYGGSTANRVRISLEVLEAMRGAVGPDFVIGLRMSGDDLWDESLTPEESLEIAVRHSRSGLVDYLNIVGSNVNADVGISRLIPTMGQRTAPFLQRARAIKEAVEVPVFHATRITDLETARHAVREGWVDMVAMTRAHIADPHIVRKLERGETDRIRPCVGAGYCIDRIYVGGDALCIHNAATGREATIPHVVRPTEGPRRRVVVVGGGPAGLEAARVAALRGHAVTLFEATDRLGGQVNLAARLPRRQEIVGVALWLAREVELAGVDVRLNAFADAGDVLALDPDVVVVATGGTPDTGFVREGEDLVLSSWDVLAGQAKPTGDILVYDGTGQHQGLSAAEHLASQGHRVTVMSPDRRPAEELGATNSARFLKALYERGVRFVTDERLVAVRREGNGVVAHARNMYTEAERLHRADHVVVEHGTVPADELYHELKGASLNRGLTDPDALAANRPQPALARLGEGAGYALFRVGDAVASRNIHAAVYDSIRLLKDL
jgi:2,4-dienoyl-CoA reductase-like NADH-dependent reductase (Old Yellow Enzyme family)